MKRFSLAGERSALSANNISRLLFAILLAFCPLGSLFAQTTSTTQTIERVTAGQRVPEEFWTTEFEFYDHEKVYTKTLEEYRGKPILLSFWMVYCGPCMASFPILNGFKAKYGDNLVILPVNSFERDSIPIIHARFSKRDESYRMPVIINDNYLNQVFPHGPIPHYIWIQPDGKLGGVTRRTFVTEENIANFVGENGTE